MADSYDIIISAVDSASEAFQSIINTVQEFGSSVTDTVSNAGDEFDSMAENVSGFQDAVESIDDESIQELADELGLSSDEVERLIETGANLGSIPFNDAAAAADELELEIDEAADAMERLGSAGDVKAADTLMSMSESVTGFMQSAANTAGSFQDSMTRVSLAAEGAGVSVDDMTTAISTMSDETGRAGSSIRESFIAMISAGITDMNTMQTVFQGASAQAFILGTDVNALADKFAGMAMKSTLSERTLKGTGVIMEELATAMGMTGATADEVKEKWKELDTNQRAAALGVAASMNEGKTANDEYKTSWQGLQEQVEIAKGRLERIVGSVILPVLVPAMQIASDVLNAVGDAISMIMSGPLGGLVSVLGTLAGVFVIVVTGAAGLRAILGFLQIQTTLDTAATILNTAAKILNGEASGAGAIANLLLGESFMASAAAAWTAAAGFLAAAWPLLVIVGAIALVVVAVYELGKAFGWWTDVGSMIDAIKAGIMELWEAFINHPDVQAVLQAISSALQWVWNGIVQAGQAILEFFGVATGGDFDVLHALIEGIGDAWQAITFPIRTVISVLQMLWGAGEQTANVFGEFWDSTLAPLGEWLSGVFAPVWQLIGDLINAISPFVANLSNAFTLFANGQMDLPNLIWTVLTTLFNAYVTIFSMIISRVMKWGQSILSKGVSAASNFVNGIINRIMTLPGRVYSQLMTVVGRIHSAIQSWIKAAVQKVTDLINQVHSTLSGLPNKISSALSGVVSAITQPFQNAYDNLVGIVDKIKSKAEEVTGIRLPFGGDLPMGGDIVPTSSGSSSSERTLNLNIKLDAPPHINTEQVLAALSDRNVLRELVNNRDFQVLDNQAKSRLNLKVNRSRGV